MMWKIYGVENYLTKCEGIGGKLKASIEDFIVEEVPTEISDNPYGKYLYVKIRLTNWETNRFVAKFAKALGISRKRVSFAGNKDKRGITTQYFCINPIDIDVCIDRIRNLRMKGVEVLEIRRTDKILNIGDLKGNRFYIRVIEAYPTNIDSCISEINSYGIFPNFFGPQRFGDSEPYTHIVGKYILYKDYKRAVEYYFSKYDVDEVLSEDHRDYEKIMAYHLKKNPTDYIGALKALPQNLLSLFIHAYQSYIFNRILSKRLTLDEPHIPRVGDVVFIREEIPDFKREIVVNTYNLDKIRSLAKERKVFVTAPLVGYDSKLSEGIQGEIEREILKDENIDFKLFINRDIPEVSSRGKRRAMFMPYEDLGYSIENHNTIYFTFFLYKGCYATSFLREIMKI